MKRIPTYWFALGIVVILTVWVATGDLDQAKTEAPEAAADSKNELPQVAFQTIVAENINRQLTVQGEIEAWREVVLESRLESFVEKINVIKGQRVKQGQALMILSEEDLPAQMLEAKAQSSVARSELKAAQSLFDRGLLADTELKLKEAEVARAQAAIARLERDLSHTVIRAPFAGVVEEQPVEIGASVRVGTPLLQLVDDSKLKLVGQIPQQHIVAIADNDPVDAKLLGGEVIEGRVSFIANQADATTRTYRIEASFDNPSRRRLAGATATLNVKLDTVPVHEISPALLNLDGEGRLSIQHLSAEDTVLSTPVERIKASNSALWVAGLPAETRLITLGKGFVQPGEKVRAIPESQINKEAAN